MNFWLCPILTLSVGSVCDCSYLFPLRRLPTLGQTANSRYFQVSSGITNDQNVRRNTFVCLIVICVYSHQTSLPFWVTGDVTIPLSAPLKGVDDSLIREIRMPKGTDVYVGILGSNINSDLWGEDAFEWKPDRWLGPLPDELVEARLPGIYSNLWVNTHR